MADEQEISEFYTNAVNTVTSLYDVTLAFRTQSPVRVDMETNEAVIEVRQIINVRMSPQHAKAVAILLFRQMRAYEKDHDINLPVPPELQEVWKQMLASMEE